MSADDVKVSLAARARDLEWSRIANVPSFWPWLPGKHVLRLGRILPVYYAGDPFTPRRELARRALVES